MLSNHLLRFTKKKLPTVPFNDTLKKIKNINNNPFDWKKVNRYHFN